MASLTKRGDAYYLQWYEANGDKKRRSLGKISKKEAKLQKTAKELELATGVNPMPTKRIFDVFVIEYTEWFDAIYPASAERTEQIIRLYLSPFFGSMSLNQITLQDGERYIAKRIREKAAVGTIIKELNKLKAIINKAVKYKYIEHNPLSDIQEPQELESKPPRYYTKEEMNEIVRVSPNHAHWWRLMANTGIRRSEAMQLKWEHIDLTENKIHILSTAKARTKSAKWREVPLNQGAIDAIKAFTQKDEYVFPRIKPRSVTRAFEKDLERAKIDGHLHCLRHTFCSHLVMNGKTLRAVQLLAGHSKSEVTEKYAHLSPDHMKDATDSLDF